jgi:predicted  nucleic acid-binding Zn-ribbon protein
MSVIHHALLSGVPHDYHDKVLIDNLEAGLTSSQRDTIQSCNSSQNANELLQLYNPQDAKADNSKTAHKRLKPSVISYAAAASGTDMTVANIDQPAQTQTQQPTTISSLTDQDLDQLYEKL